MKSTKVLLTDFITAMIDDSSLANCNHEQDEDANYFGYWGKRHFRG